MATRLSTPRFRSGGPGRSVLGRVLLQDPGVRLRHALAQSGGRFPVEVLLDFCVVAVASVDALRRVELVAPLPQPELLLRLGLGHGQLLLELGILLKKHTHINVNP